MRIWLHSFPRPGITAGAARAAEAAGYDGLLCADSQSLTADVWVELALAAAATERLGLGPGVTNQRTRHPAVTASAAATLAAESGGRVTLGFGRGDSALTQIGREPTPEHEFERGLAALQGYLAGEAVEVEGYAGRIAWLPREGEPKVPVAVAATGPRVIAAAARYAEEIDFTVGAEIERLRWAVETARAAAAERGREMAGDGRAANRGASGGTADGGGGANGGPADDARRREPLRLGAYINVAVDEDRDRARELVRGSASTLARFGAEGAPADGLSEVTRTGIERLAAEYREAGHGQAASAAARDLSPDFIDRFAVCGPADEVTERLREIAALGIERLIVVPGSLDSDPGAARAAAERFERDVLPALRDA
jgi:5,10-methylenetetrahydromethanopterin reductase